MVTQKFNTQSVSLTAVDGNSGTALKEGTAPKAAASFADGDFGGGDGTGYHTITFTLDSAYSDSTNNVRVKITPKNADGSTSNDVTLAGPDVSNSIITLTAADKQDKLIVFGTADGAVEGSETVTLSYEVLSDNTAYNGLVVPSNSLTINEVKANFTASALSIPSTIATDGTLRYDALSNSATGKNNTQTLDLNGTLSSTAKGSGFATPQIVAITSAGNDAGASVTFKVDGTSDGSTAISETINAGNGTTVFTSKAFKTVSTITVGGGNTTGAVSAGIGTVMEGAYSAAQAGTYTIKATDIPVSTGAAPLVLNLTSPGVTAVFDYGTTSQAISREFMVDDNKISTESSGAISNGSLAMVGGTTVTLGSPTFVTVKSFGNDGGGKFFWITGKNSNNQTVTDKVAGGNNSTVTSSIAFKTVDSIVLKDGNGSSQNATATANKVMAGVTDENKEYTVTVFATQDSTDELNPHNVAIKHAIYQNDSSAQAYIGAIADKTIAVQDVNAPVASDNTVQMSKNTAYTFKTADFGYSDADGDAMTKVKITQLEAAGTLAYNSSGSTWNDVTLNQEITVANIAKLKFTPATDAGGSGYGNFKFMVHDGLSYSANAATMKVNVGDSVQTTIKYYAQNKTGTAADQ